MQDILDILPPESQAVVNEIILLLDQQKYEDSMQLAYSCLSMIGETNTDLNQMLKVKIATLLIDIGSEGNLEKPIQDGLDLYEQNLEFISQVENEASTEYNLGNGKYGLFCVKSNQPDFRIKPDTVDLLIEAKNHYWRAFKKLPPDQPQLYCQLLVNLANTLRTLGRITEALQYYNTVLEERPDFAKANSNRGQALLFLHELSGSYSVTMLRQAAEAFDNASKSSEEPRWHVELWSQKKDWLLEALKQHGYQDHDWDKNDEETAREVEALSRYRNFCLENHLNLSEHGLYCNCYAARNDNITIPKTQDPISGDFVLRMEHRLNRMKSEFALARLLYYQAMSEEFMDWSFYSEETEYTELYEYESIGIKPEMIRTSFRICFGILDKIAYAICDLFDLTDNDEPVAFERFWKPRGRKLSDKQKERWAKICSIDNHSLVALYSQASDLNLVGGEWGILKAWRNSLEHEILVLLHKTDQPPDLYGVLDTTHGLQKVQFEDFIERTLHLLQLTRSAIFNFVFCVRAEGAREQGGNGISTTLGPKIFTP